MGKFSSQNKTGLVLTFTLHRPETLTWVQICLFPQIANFQVLKDCDNSSCETEEKNIFLASICAMFSPADMKALESSQLLSLFYR